jgi:amino-acid N-acetyltransferase
MISGLTTESVSDSAEAAASVEIRKARMSDVPALLELINGYAARGIMLPRTEFEISESIRDFSIALADGTFAGCGALHFYSPTTAEIRSLAVEQSARTRGIGRRLVETLVNEAAEYSLDAVFAFTYVPDFFRKMGFAEVERGSLPLKAWKDCLRCPKFQSCDEIAMIRVLHPDNWTRVSRDWGGSIAPNEGIETIVLPLVRKQ